MESEMKCSVTSDYLREKCDVGIKQNKTSVLEMALCVHRL